MELKNKFKSIRKHHGLSQEKMAEKLGIARGTYINYELGERIPLADLLIKLVSLFNINPIWLLTDKGKMFDNRVMAEIREPDNLDCRIINAIYGMEDEKKKGILRHIEREKLLDELLEERGRVCVQAKLTKKS